MRSPFRRRGTQAADERAGEPAAEVPAAPAAAVRAAPPTPAWRQVPTIQRVVTPPMLASDATGFPRSLAGRSPVGVLRTLEHGLGADGPVGRVQGLVSHAADVTPAHTTAHLPPVPEGRAAAPSRTPWSSLPATITEGPPATDDAAPSAATAAASEETAPSAPPAADPAPASSPGQAAVQRQAVGGSVEARPVVATPAAGSAPAPAAAPAPRELPTVPAGAGVPASPPALEAPAGSSTPDLTVRRGAIHDSPAPLGEGAPHRPSEEAGEPTAPAPPTSDAGVGGRAVTGSTGPGVAAPAVEPRPVLPAPDPAPGRRGSPLERPTGLGAPRSWPVVARHAVDAAAAAPPIDTPTQEAPSGPWPVLRSTAPESGVTSEPVTGGPAIDAAPPAPPGTPSIPAAAPPASTPASSGAPVGDATRRIGLGQPVVSPSSPARAPVQRAVAPRSAPAGVGAERRSVDAARAGESTPTTPEPARTASAPVVAAEGPPLAAAPADLPRVVARRVEPLAAPGRPIGAPALGPTPATTTSLARAIAPGPGEAPEPELVGAVAGGAETGGRAATGSWADGPAAILPVARTATPSPWDEGSGPALASPAGGSGAPGVAGVLQQAIAAGMASHDPDGSVRFASPGAPTTSAGPAVQRAVSIDEITTDPAPAGPAGSPPSTPTGMVDPDRLPDLSRLADQLYDRLERRLRTDLLHDRERKRMLADPR